MRWLAAAGAMALLAAGCGGTTTATSPSPGATGGPSSPAATGGSPSPSGDPTGAPQAAQDIWVAATDDTSGEGGHPPVLATDGVTVQRLEDGTVEVVGRVEPVAGLAAGDGAGTVVVERLPAPGADAAEGLVELGESGAAPVPTAEAQRIILYDMVRRDGVPHVLYGRRTDGQGEEPAGPVVLHNLSTGATTTITTAFAVEFHTAGASAARDLVVTSGFADLTETFAFHRYDGSEVEDRYDPTADLPYNAPPQLVHATLSPDGDKLAYLSGPDWVGPVGTTRQGRWELVVVDRAGNEEVRLTLAAKDAELTHLDYDGRWALVSAAAEGDPRPPLLVDTTTAGTPARMLPPVRGRTTLDTAASG